MLGFSGFLTLKGFDRLHFNLWETFFDRLTAEGRNPEEVKKPAQPDVIAAPDDVNMNAAVGADRAADEAMVAVMDEVPAADEDANKYEPEDTHKSRKLTSLRSDGIYPGFLPWEKLGYFDELQKVCV